MESSLVLASSDGMVPDRSQLERDKDLRLVAFPMVVGILPANSVPSSKISTIMGMDPIKFKLNVPASENTLFVM